MKEGIVEIFDTFLDSKFDNIHTCIPAKIIEYYGHKERKAKVQPLIKLTTSKNLKIEIPPIDDVPVIFSGTKEMRMVFKLQKNDTGLLLFSEIGIGKFLNGFGNIVDSDDINRFDLKDGIFIPGLFGFNFAPKPPENDNDFFLEYQDNFKLQVSDKTNYFQITDGSNKIKSGPTSIKINGSDVLPNLEILQ